MLCWTRLCVALHVSHGQPLIPAHDPEMTGREPRKPLEVYVICAKKKKKDCLHAVPASSHVM